MCMDESVASRKDAVPSASEPGPPQTGSAVANPSPSGGVAQSQEAKDKQASVWRRVGASWYYAAPNAEDPQKPGNHSLEYRLAGHTPDRAHDVFDQVDRSGRTIRGRSVTFTGGSSDKPAPQAIGDTEFVRTNASAPRRQVR